MNEIGIVGGRIASVEFKCYRGTKGGMTDIDRIDQRLAAVERVVVDGDVAVDELADLTALIETVDSLETRQEEHEARLGTIEASVQSVEGYVGNVESISDDVARQAASAVATVDRLERRLDVLEADLEDVAGGILESGEGDRYLGGTDANRSDLDESKSDCSDLADGDAREGTDDKMAVFEFGVVHRKLNGESVDNAPAVERSARGSSGESTASEPDVEPSAREPDVKASSREPGVERSVRKLFEDSSKSGAIVDDGVDRPGSSATQSAIDSAVAERDGKQATNRSENTERQGLLGSIRSQLS